MKTIGLIGGMSCESTALYYKRLNDRVRAELGGLHSAEVLLWSVDFAPIAELQRSGHWDEAGRRLAEIARRLEGAGADLIVLATNTMHKVAPAIEARISVPFVHIADATAEAVKAAGKSRPAIMATRFTMEEDFYIGRLMDRHGLDVMVPDEADRVEIHRVIFDELCRGVTSEAGRKAYVNIAARLVEQGADCLLLGCTEVGMLLNASNVAVPVFDTTEIHADAALALALNQNLRRIAAE